MLTWKFSKIFRATIFTLHVSTAASEFAYGNYIVNILHELNMILE